MGTEINPNVVSIVVVRWSEMKMTSTDDDFDRVQFIGQLHDLLKRSRNNHLVALVRQEIVTPLNHTVYLCF